MASVQPRYHLQPNKVPRINESNSGSWTESTPTSSSTVNGIKHLWDRRLRVCRTPSQPQEDTRTPHRNTDPQIINSSIEKGTPPTEESNIGGTESIGGLTDTPPVRAASVGRRASSVGPGAQDSTSVSSHRHRRSASSIASDASCLGNAEKRQTIKSSAAHKDIFTIATSAALPSSEDLRRSSEKAERYLQTHRTRSRSSQQRQLRHKPLEPAQHVDPVAKPLFRNFLLQEVREPSPTLTVVLDLDETLVNNRTNSFCGAILRPYCLHFLNALRKTENVEIIMWTASTKETATPIAEQLECKGVIFDDVICRNDLWFTEPIHTKDLRLLGRDMDRVVIVDNAVSCCKLNARNAILIEDFRGPPHRDEASLINIYYMIQSLLQTVQGGGTVRDGLQKLLTEDYFCREVMYPLPEAWKHLPLSAISPIKIPAYGKYVMCNSTPLPPSVMKYWVY